MSRILVANDGFWYYELNTIAYYYESEYEASIIQQLKVVFPDFIAFSFKELLHSNGRKPRKPDLVLIRNDYTEWWLVEVELESHGIQHIRSQVEVFCDLSDSSIDLIQKILNQAQKQNIQIDANKLPALVKEKSPKVLVVIDHEKPELDELKALGAHTCLFEIFKSTAGFEAYRLSGVHPKIHEKQSHCRYAQNMPNVLEVNLPDIVPESLEIVELIYEGRVTKWKRLSDNNKVFLRFVGSVNPIPENTQYVISRDTQGKFYIKR